MTGSRESVKCAAGVAIAACVVFGGGCGKSGDEGKMVETTALVEPSGETIAVSFAVEGMHCDGCAEAIVATVEKLDGVVACEASYEGSSANVSVTDPSAKEAVVAAIEKMGFEVEVVEGG